MLETGWHLLKTFYSRHREYKKAKKDLQIRLDHQQKITMTAEEKASVSEKVFAEEEQAVRELKHVISKTRDFHFRKKQVP